MKILALLCLSLASPAPAAETRFAYRTAAPEALVLADEKGSTVKSVDGKAVLDLVWEPKGEALIVTAPASGAMRGIFGVSPDGLHVDPLPGDASVSSVGWDAPRDRMIVAFDGDVAAIGSNMEWSHVCSPKDKTFYASVQPSPDGKRWAFVGAPGKEKNEKFKLYSSAARCDATATLLDAKYPDGPYGWSPDSKSLAYVDSKAHAVVVLSADGKKRRELKDRWYLTAAWTDDGRLLASWADKKANPVGLVDPATGKAAVLIADSQPPATWLAWRPRAKKK